MVIEIKGVEYSTIDSGVFTEYGGVPAKVVSGVNTPSGEAVAINVNGKWQFINKTP